MLRLAKHAVTESKDVMNKGPSAVHVSDLNSNADTESLNLQSMFKQEPEELARMPCLSFV